MKSAVIAVVAAKYYNRGAIDFNTADVQKVHEDFAHPAEEARQQIGALAQKVEKSGDMHPQNKDLAGKDPVKAMHNHICHKVCQNMMNWDEDFLADCDTDYSVMSKCVKDMHHQISHCCGKEVHLSKDAKKHLIKGVMHQKEFKHTLHHVLRNKHKSEAESRLDTDMEADVAAAKKEGEKKGAKKEGEKKGEKKTTEKKTTEKKAKKTTEKKSAKSQVNAAGQSTQDVAAPHHQGRGSYRNMRRSDAWGMSHETAAEAKQPATFDMGAMQIPDEWLAEYENTPTKDVAAPEKPKQKQAEAQKEAEEKNEKNEKIETAQTKEQNKAAATEPKKVAETAEKLLETPAKAADTPAAADATPVKEAVPAAQVLASSINNAYCMSATTAVAAIAFQFLY